MTDTPLTLTAENFDSEVLASDRPVLVDFWADWCGPCLALGPTIDALAAQFAGRAKVAKVHIEDARELADAYAIRAVPSLLFFADGKLQTRHAGLLKQKEIAAKLEELIRNN